MWSVKQRDWNHSVVNRVMFTDAYIHDLPAVATLLRRLGVAAGDGSGNVWFHTDAVQAPGHEQLPHRIKGTLCDSWSRFHHGCAGVGCRFPYGVCTQVS